MSPTQALIPGGDGTEDFKIRGVSPKKLKIGDFFESILWVKDGSLVPLGYKSKENC